MIAMARGDIVFLPNVPTPGTTFTVTRIADAQYWFDDRGRPDPNAVWEVDYGHCRRIRDTRQFQYGPDTLPTSTFGSPYRHAIDRVNAREAELREFLERHYTAF